MVGKRDTSTQLSLVSDDSASFCSTAARPCLAAALRSTKTRRITAESDTQHTPTPSHTGCCRSLYRVNSAGDTWSLTTLPRRATERLRPIAKAISLPSNHSASRVLWATLSDSPPKPKTALPTRHRW